MQKISPFLWFDSQAEEAAQFYVSVFKNSKIDKITRYPEGPADRIGREPGSVMTVEFTLDGAQFIGLNAGPLFKFTEAVSFAVMCETQEEIDYYWEKLTADGGEPGPCSWCKDKFGLSWQVQPRLLIELIGDSDKAKAERVMNAMMDMHKIDIATLERAAKG
ncbi:MAG TPA: VOC family protein [Chthoniobacterales bacterium]|nr:VOC family protein [Chthoniobacterales bacterium]